MNKIYSYYLCLCILFCNHIVKGQVVIKTLKAFKLEEAVKIDGKLTEAVWGGKDVATNFIVQTPNLGEASTYNTEVKVLYTNYAVYVGAYMYANPLSIRKQFTARDREGRADVDYFSVSIDPYNDNTNAFTFLVTAAGVQSDSRISASTGEGDFGVNADYNWDAVWDSKVSFTDKGWCAEFMIPLSAIRFPKKALQTWGIQFTRQIRSVNEVSNWNPTDRNMSGTVNQYGDLTDLNNLTPPIRLAFLPYVTVGASKNDVGNGNFATQKILNGGMDVKYGINESFTLDATLVPDFGQVQSDNQVLNLTPFEVRFTEFRPFFQEGTELFNKSELFYSRRIGDIPNGYYKARNATTLADIKSNTDSSFTNDTITLQKNPSATQLYNAIKISGFNKKNIGIGIFNAVTAPTNAIFKNKRTGENIQYETSVLTNYNIIVVDKIFKNRSYVTFTNTNVLRNGQAKDANVSALDVRLVDKQNRYELLSRGRFSSISGTNNYNGFNTYIGLGKTSGSLIIKVSANVESNTYDINDLGFLYAPNEVNYKAQITYRTLKPRKNFINRSISLFNETVYLYKPSKYQSVFFGSSIFYLFKNFWDQSLQVATIPAWYNDAFESRTFGINLKKAPLISVSMRGSTDSRKKLFVRWNGSFTETTNKNDPAYAVELGTRYRFNRKFQLEASYRIDVEEGQFGYALQRDNKTYFANRLVKNINNIISAAYNFNALMSATIRVRHNWTNVKNYAFYTANTAGYLVRPTTFIPNENKNFNAFNVDAFYTWIMTPGSRVILNWQNSLSGLQGLNAYEYTNYNRNIKGVFNNPHNNQITLRVIWYLDYLNIKKTLTRNK
jgi:hypothetical protein